MSTPAFVARTVAMAVVGGSRDCRRPAAVLDRADPQSRHAGAHSACQPRELHPKPCMGLNYFIVPYGALILVLPFILLRGSAVRRLRPLLLGFWLPSSSALAARRRSATCSWAAPMKC